MGALIDYDSAAQPGAPEKVKVVGSLFIITSERFFYCPISTVSIPNRHKQSFKEKKQSIEWQNYFDLNLSAMACVSQYYFGIA